MRVLVAGLSLVSIAACAGRTPARRAAIASQQAPTCADAERVARADSAEPAALAATGGRVARTGCVLRIRTASGRAVTLTDDYTEGERFVQYVYRGSLPALSLDIVEVAHYEGGAHLVVDRNSAQTPIAGAPVPSPDRRRFLALSLDLEAGYQPNVIEVWRVDDGSPSLEIAVRPDEWGPSDAHWRDDSTITFVQNFPRYTEEGYERRPARLVRAARSWTVEQGTHGEPSRISPSVEHASPPSDHPWRHPLAARQRRLPPGGSGRGASPSGRRGDLAPDRHLHLRVAFR